MSFIKQCAKAICLPVIEKYNDKRAEVFLRKLNSKTHEKGKPMKVGFIVFEPETWDKQDKVYRELKANSDIETKLIVVPSFDKELKVTKEYGNEWTFFHSIDNQAIRACGEDGRWTDLSEGGFDYIFYQDPYNEHMPTELRSNRMVKYSKICYIPYGYVGSDVFNQGVTNKDFYRNVYCAFTDIEEVCGLLNQKFAKNVKNGIQRFLRLGYPALMDYYNTKQKEKISRILWTPRWSYHPEVGGSNFFENRDGFVSLADRYPDLSLCIRPHPMMFMNFIREGLMTESEKEVFLRTLKDKKIDYSQGRELREDLGEADVLITDYSSIIPQFYMSGKPIIYCTSCIKLNKTFVRLSEGMYIADNWNQVEAYLDELIKGNDSLADVRQKIIKDMVEENKDAAERITACLINDYKASEK